MKVNNAANIRRWRTEYKNPSSKEPDAQAGAERLGERRASAALETGLTLVARPFHLKLGVSFWSTANDGMGRETLSWSARFESFRFIYGSGSRRREKVQQGSTSLYVFGASADAGRVDRIGLQFLRQGANQLRVGFGKNKGDGDHGDLHFASRYRADDQWAAVHRP